MAWEHGRTCRRRWVFRFYAHARFHIDLFCFLSDPPLPSHRRPGLSSPRWLVPCILSLCFVINHDVIFNRWLSWSIWILMYFFVCSWWFLYSWWCEVLSWWLRFLLFYLEFLNLSQLAMMPLCIFVFWFLFEWFMLGLVFLFIYLGFIIASFFCQSPQVGSRIFASSTRLVICQHPVCSFCSGHTLFVMTEASKRKFLPWSPGDQKHKSKRSEQTNTRHIQQTH